jgi:FMN reductase
MYLVISTSLHPDSRSRILATEAMKELQQTEVPCQLIDLAAIKPLPPCNGHDCYNDPLVGDLAGRIAGASGILIAAPVYNYDVSASCKNLVELTGSAWNDRIVGLLCAAGGLGSYMSPMGLCSSLMLDFRCLILPRFVYATGDCFGGGRLHDKKVARRIEELVQQLVRVASALHD